MKSDYLVDAKYDWDVQYEFPMPTVENQMEKGRRMKTSENKNLAGEMSDLVDSLKERALASGVFDSLMADIHEQIKSKAENGLRILDTCNFSTNFQEAIIEEIIKALREEGFKVKLKHVWSFFSHTGDGYKYLHIKW